MADGALETDDGISVAFGDGFQSAIREISNETVETFRSSPLLREVTEAHSLHSTSNDIAARGDHVRPAALAGGNRQGIIS